MTCRCKKIDETSFDNGYKDTIAGQFSAAAKRIAPTAHA